jgi:glycosyltransferase involved in cell wall biosynthesis
VRVTHVTTSLEPGGAQAMLHKLVAATAGVEHDVVSLTDEGVYGPRLRAAGAPVATLGLRAGVPDPRALARLALHLRRGRPDVVQCWMYHANLLGGLAAAAVGVPVVWGIHHADVDPRHVKRLTHLTRTAGAWLSRLVPARVVCCADASLEAHARAGYDRDRMLVVTNGFAVDQFAPDPEARRAVRRELAIADGTAVVGLVARIHPDKDPWNFLAAAAHLVRAHPDSAFVLVGEGATGDDAALARWIAELGLGPRVRLLGLRADVPRLLASFDLLMQSSRTEAFPQVVCEAMLCGVPCAATDCGDTREIVGELGRVVRPGDPAALAAAALELLRLPAAERAALGAAARERIRARCDLRVIARRYAEVWAEAAGAPAGAALTPGP